MMMLQLEIEIWEVGGEKIVGRKWKSRWGR